MLYNTQQLHKHNIYLHDSGGIMDFRNVGNLGVLFLKSSKDKHMRMRHLFFNSRVLHFELELAAGCPGF